MAREEYPACLIIEQADQNRYVDLKKLFVNNGLKGDTIYPKTLEAVFLIFKGWKPTGTEKQNQDNTAATKNKVFEHKCYLWI